MTLDEAIKHCKDVANDINSCSDCKDEHLQLAKWLSELKKRKSNTITIEDLYQWALDHDCATYDLTIKCFNEYGLKEEINFKSYSQFLEKRDNDFDVVINCCD